MSNFAFLQAEWPLMYESALRIDAKLRNQFATRLTATKKVRQTLIQSLDEMNSLFDSLQHRAFAGEL